MHDIISEWVLTDPDTAQYRRRLPDVDGAPVFELVEVHQYHDIFRVGHGRIYFAFDLTDEEVDSLCSTYGVKQEDYPPEDWYGILAEMSFESSATEYDTGEEHDNFESAEKAVLAIVNADDPHPEKDKILTIGQFCKELESQFNRIPDVSKQERVHLTLSLLAQVVNSDPILSPCGMVFHISTRIHGWNDMFISSDLPPVPPGGYMEYSPALGGLPRDFFWREFITAKKIRATNSWKVFPTKDTPEFPLQLILLRQARLTELMRNAGYDTIRAIDAFFSSHNISCAEQQRLMAMLDFLSSYRPGGHAAGSHWLPGILNPVEREQVLATERRTSRFPKIVDHLLDSEVRFLTRKSSGQKEL